MASKYILLSDKRNCFSQKQKKGQIFLTFEKVKIKFANEKTG